MRFRFVLSAAMVVLVAVGSSALALQPADSSEAAAVQEAAAVRVVRPTNHNPDRNLVEAKASLQPIIHTVVAGEYLSTIAPQYQTDWLRLWNANPTISCAGAEVEFTNQNLLAAGCQLRIPFYWENPETRDLYKPPPPPPSSSRRGSRYATGGTAAGPVASTGVGGGEPTDADFDRLAQCESGGRWNLNTGNGYYGGIQFDAPTWRSVGGTGLPHEHSRETQIEMGRRLWRKRGWAPWPSCSSQLGWR